MARDGKRNAHSPRATAPKVHIGRGWEGVSDLENNCPCGKGECGLVDADRIDPSCPEHSLGAAKTIRQMHFALECPDRERWP